MTPIKSLAMTKRLLEKAFVCKSHVMIMTHSKWRLLFSTCLLWDGPAIYFFFWAGVGGGGGLAKEKQNHAQEKEKKLVHKEAWENIYASLTYLWDLYNGNVRKEILIFLILFEWKVLNRHNFDLPDINQYCSHCRISVNLQWKDFQDKPWINSICFGNESKQCLFFKVFSSAN